MSDDLARFGSLSSDDVARLDAAAASSGVSVVQLMEIAGWQVARCAWRMLHHAPARVAVVAGRGNNGGDGLVAARHLAAWGCSVHAVVVAEGRTSLKQIVATHLDAAETSGVHTGFAADAVAVRDAMRGSALVVDALLGTGLRGAPRELDAAAIGALGGPPVLAVDVPSGLDASTGEPFDPCVHATATCTLAAMKRGLWQPRGRAAAGTLFVADIGMPQAAWRDAGRSAPAAVRGGALLRVPVD